MNCNRDEPDWDFPSTGMTGRRLLSPLEAPPTQPGNATAELSEQSDSLRDRWAHTVPLFCWYMTGPYFSKCSVGKVWIETDFKWLPHTHMYSAATDSQ